MADSPIPRAHQAPALNTPSHSPPALPPGPSGSRLSSPGLASLLGSSSSSPGAPHLPRGPHVPPGQSLPRSGPEAMQFLSH